MNQNHPPDSCYTCKLVLSEVDDSGPKDRCTITSEAFALPDGLVKSLESFKVREAESSVFENSSGVTGNPVFLQRSDGKCSTLIYCRNSRMKWIIWSEYPMNAKLRFSVGEEIELNMAQAVTSFVKQEDFATLTWPKQVSEQLKLHDLDIPKPLVPQ